MVCNHTKFIWGYVLIILYNHTKYIQLYVWSKVWNYTKYIKLHKILQMYYLHYRTKINSTETIVFRRVILLWGKSFLFYISKITIGLQNMHQIVIAYVSKKMLTQTFKIR